MDFQTVFEGLAYVVAAYMLAYLLYLLVRSAEKPAAGGYPEAPYDSCHLILKRRYI